MSQRVIDIREWSREDQEIYVELRAELDRGRVLASMAADQRRQRRQAITAIRQRLEIPAANRPASQGRHPRRPSVDFAVIVVIALGWLLGLLGVIFAGMGLVGWLLKLIVRWAA